MVHTSHRAIVCHIWYVRRLWPRGTNICLKDLVLGPYFQDQSQVSSQGLARLAVSRGKPSERSALSMPAFSVLPTSCRDSAGKDRGMTARIWHMGSLPTQGLSGSEGKCAVV